MDQIQHLPFPLIKLPHFLSPSFFLLLPQGCCLLSDGLFVLWLILAHSLVPSPESWLQQKCILCGLLTGAVKWQVMVWFALWLRKRSCVNPCWAPLCRRTRTCYCRGGHVLSSCEPPAASPSISPKTSLNKGGNFLWELSGKSGMFRGCFNIWAHNSELFSTWKPQG